MPMSLHRCSHIIIESEVELLLHSLNVLFNLFGSFFLPYLYAVYVVVYIVTVYLTIEVVGYIFAVILARLVSGRRFNEREFRRNWEARRRERVRFLSVEVLG